MLRDKQGFTLIELLIVMVIIAVTTSIVAPVAYKSVEKFNGLIAKQEQINLIKSAEYLSFIKDSPCKIEKNKIVCSKTVYLSLEDALK